MGLFLIIGGACAFYGLNLGLATIHVGASVFRQLLMIAHSL